LEIFVYIEKKQYFCSAIHSIKAEGYNGIFVEMPDK